MPDLIPRPTTLDALFLQTLQAQPPEEHERLMGEYRTAHVARAPEKKPISPVVKWSVGVAAVVSLLTAGWFFLGLAAELKGMVDNSRGYKDHVENEELARAVYASEQEKRTSAILDRIATGEAALLKALGAHQAVEAHPIALERLKYQRRDIDRNERAARRRRNVD